MDHSKIYFLEATEKESWENHLSKENWSQKDNQNCSKSS
jgi:hypothetical protein